MNQYLVNSESTGPPHRTVTGDCTQQYTSRSDPARLCIVATGHHAHQPALQARDDAPRWAVRRWFDTLGPEVVGSLDPLGANAACAAVPSMNANADTTALVAALRQLLPGRGRHRPASVGSPPARAGCQASTGSWLTTGVERTWLRSSMTSSKSLPSMTLGGVSRKSSSTSRPILARCPSRRT